MKFKFTIRFRWRYASFQYIVREYLSDPFNWLFISIHNANGNFFRTAPLRATAMGYQTQPSNENFLHEHYLVKSSKICYPAAYYFFIKFQSRAIGITATIWNCKLVNFLHRKEDAHKIRPCITHYLTFIVVSNILNKELIILSYKQSICDPFFKRLNWNKNVDAHTKLY